MLGVKWLDKGTLIFVSALHPHLLTYFDDPMCRRCNCSVTAFSQDLS